MKLFKKTALAVATAAIAASANADVNYSFVAGDKTVVLASEIFGDETGNGSNETLIVMENTELNLDTATVSIVADGDNLDPGATATVKYTLGGEAVFAEDLSTTAAVLAANGGAGVFSCSAGPVNAVVADNLLDDSTCGDNTAPVVEFEVAQGGAINDNTITFRLTNTSGAEASIGGLVFGNVAVKELTAALGDSGTENFRGKVAMGVEYVEGFDPNGGGVAETTPDSLTTTATDTPLIVLGSMPGLALNGMNSTDLNGGDYIRINVGGGEVTFTNGGDGRVDFDADGESSFVELGTLELERQDIDLTDFPNAIAGIVKKENGDDFDFQGGDTHTLKLTPGSGTLLPGALVYLDVIGNDCSGGTPADVPDITGEIATVAADGSATFTLAGTTTELTKPHEVCYVTNGVSVIPEVDNIAASWTVDFFNTRYDDQEVTYESYGPLLRNGCIASFFNVPASANSDTAYIRLSNTSSANAGDIRGTLYAQDGTILAADKTIAPELAIHATQVFSTEGETRTSGAGEEIIDLESAFEVDGADYKGRARLVLKGAFDTCEGQGLIRTEGGSLFNMTSTTQGNDTGVDGNNGN